MRDIERNKLESNLRKMIIYEERNYLESGDKKILDRIGILCTQYEYEFGDVLNIWRKLND